MVARGMSQQCSSKNNRLVFCLLKRVGKGSGQFIGRGIGEMKHQRSKNIDIP